MRKEIAYLLCALCQLRMCILSIRHRRRLANMNANAVLCGKLVRKQEKRKSTRAICARALNGASNNFVFSDHPAQIRNGVTVVVTSNHKIILAVFFDYRNILGYFDIEISDRQVLFFIYQRKHVWRKQR